MPRTYHEWQAALKQLEEALAVSPTDVNVANRYWNELRGYPGFDYRSGDLALRIFRSAAIASPEGARSLAKALYKLADDSGEFPSAPAFDEKLREALFGTLDTEPIDSDLRWLCDFLRDEGRPGDG